MGKTYFINLSVLILLIGQPCAMAQTSANIAVPKWNDNYSKAVARLEKGETNVDFRELRFSFLESKQSDIKNEQFALFDSLEKEMFQQAHLGNSRVVISISKRILSIDYTYIWAQKYLYQSYKIIGDSANMKKYKNIELGLLKSICSPGNGHSCESCWEASQVYEEYFVLNMAGAKMQKQSLVQCTGQICDRLDVQAEDGTDKEYYFDVTKMMENTERKLNAKK